MPSNDEVNFRGNAYSEERSRNVAPLSNRPFLFFVLTLQSFFFGNGLISLAIFDRRCAVADVLLGASYHELWSWAVLRRDTLISSSLIE